MGQITDNKFNLNYGITEVSGLIVQIFLSIFLFLPFLEYYNLILQKELISATVNLFLLAILNLILITKVDEFYSWLQKNMALMIILSPIGVILLYALFSTSYSIQEKTDLFFRVLQFGEWVIQTAGAVIYPAIVINLAIKTRQKIPRFLKT